VPKRIGESYSVTNRAKRLLNLSFDILRYAVATSSSSSRTSGAFLSVLACSNLSRHDLKSKTILVRTLQSKYCHASLSSTIRFLLYEGLDERYEGNRMSPTLSLSPWQGIRCPSSS